MKTEKICGSTLDRAEIIVDYRKKYRKIQIKGVPKETKSNIVCAAFKEWFFFLLPYFLGVVGIMLVLGMITNELKIKLWLHSEKGVGITIATWFITLFIISISLGLFHLNKKFDKKWRKWFVLRTEPKEKNRAVFSNFRSKVFTIYDFDNVILSYDTNGDVEKQLYMVWIKEEPYSTMYNHQAKIERLSFTKDMGTKWNAYFFFEEIPKDGELSLEWI